MAVLILPNPKHFPPELLADADHVYTLNLSRHFQLSRNKDITVFQKLRELSLSFCGLSYFPLEVTELRELRVIDASNNEINKLPENIGNLLNLEVFNLSFNKIRELPDDIGKLVSLKELNLDKNELSQLPHSIGNLRNLIGLGLFENVIIALPDSMKNLTQLEYFRVGENLLGAPSELSIASSPSIRMRVRINVEQDSESNIYSRPEMVAFRSLITKFTSLKYLDLQQCDWFDVPEDFKDLSMLQQLILNCNPLEYVPPAIFTLPNLSMLHLHSCALKVVPEAVKMLSKLTLLDLSKNQLTTLPPQLGDLEMLENLIVSENPLRIFPTWIARVVSLKVLKMQLCCLPDIPADIVKLSKLEELDVSYNFLVSLPGSIGDLMQLTSLTLSGNKISRLPETIEGLQKLSTLDLSPFRAQKTFATATQAMVLNILSSNELKSLPDNIGKLTSLSTLNLSSNELSKLPDGFGKLENLEFLDLSNNNLCSLPEGFGELKSLSTLNLSSNELRKLPYGFGKLENLEFLDLSTNNLSSLPEEFVELKSLSTVNLSSNGLRNLPDGFSKLENLDILDLSINNLSCLPEGFGELKSLKQVNLSNNISLKKLPASFKELTRLECLLFANCRIQAEELPTLANIKTVDLSSSELIFKIPVAILSWSTLTVLRLQSCQLRGLPKMLSTLIMLEELSISNNSAVSSFPDVITELPRLEMLDVACCSLPLLPPSIAALTQLTHLFAGNNCFKNYPAATMELQSLLFLDLSNSVQGMNRNRIEELPKDLVNKPQTLQVLLLWGTGTKFPPEEICDIGLSAIKQFLKAVELGDERFCAESVCLLGETCAGKTSIFLSMKEQVPRVTEHEDRTRVVERDVIELDGRLVTVNDFGGHEIYQTVLPVFLPRKGVAILAYDLSESWDVQVTKVQKWMATVIARSPGMNLIIAGTHADLVEQEQLSEYKKRMTSVVKEMFSQAISELKGHHNKRSSFRKRHTSKQSSTLGTFERCDSPSSAVAATVNPQVPERNFGTGLTEAAQLLESTYKAVVTLSCKDASKGDGVLLLKDEILRIIRPGIRMPDKWVRFMTELLSSKTPMKRTHLTMDETRAIFFRCVEQQDDTILLTILKYLVATSRIIWLESHPELRQCVFHRVSVIQDVCKAILHHDNPQVPRVFEDDIKKYRLGQLTPSLYKHFLSGYGTDAELTSLRELLQTFNVVCSGMDHESDIMIVPSLLPQDIRPSARHSTGFSDASASFFPQVCVRMEFSASIIPLAFFETSLASLVDKIIKMGKAKPKCWKNGLSYNVDDLTMCYERSDGAVKVATAAASERVTFCALWKELHELLAVVIQHVERMWPGAMPKVRFVCPTLLYAADGPDFSGHGRELPIEEIIRDQEPGGQHKYSCDECEQSIPRVFYFYCKPEQISADNEKDALAFLEKMKRQRGGQSEAKKSKREPQLAEKFRKERVNIIRRLDGTSIPHIIDILYGDGYLTNYQKELIEAQSGRYEMARTLVDMIDPKGPEAIQAFLNALESKDVGLHDLARNLKIDNLTTD